MMRAFASAIVLASTVAYAQAPPPGDPPSEPVPAAPSPDQAKPAARTIPRTLVEEPPPPFAPWPTARLVLELELYTQARWTRRAGADLTELRLDRGEVGARIALGATTAAELRLEAVRSAIEGGSLGIDGDSTVVRVKYAQALGSYTVGRVRFEGAIGFVPDPWIQSIEEDYTLAPLSRSASERMLGWPTSDLSALVRASFGPARLSVAVGNGEGPRFPERNSGKTTTAVLELVPVQTRDLRLSITGVGRDGSVGVAAVRERRAGGGLTVVTPWVRAGGEAIRAWGIGDRGEAEGWVFGGWANVSLIDHLDVALRGATLGFAAGGRASTFGGAVAIDPRRASPGAPGRFRLWLAVDRVTSSGSAMPLPGADAGDATLVMLIASAIAPFTVD